MEPEKAHSAQPARRPPVVARPLARQEIHNLEQLRNVIAATLRMDLDVELRRRILTMQALLDEVFRSG